MNSVVFHVLLSPMMSAAISKLSENTTPFIHGNCGNSTWKFWLNGLHPELIRKEKSHLKVLVFLPLFFLILQLLHSVQSQELCQ